MGLNKGTTNNPNGRPKGKPNKITGDLREMIKNFLYDKYEDFTTSFAAMPADEKVKAYTALLKYSIPTLQSTKEEVDFNNFSEAQLDYIIECIKTGKKPTVSEIKAIAA